MISTRPRDLDLANENTPSSWKGTSYITNLTCFTCFIVNLVKEEPPFGIKYFIVIITIICLPFNVFVTMSHLKFRSWHKPLLARHSIWQIWCHRDPSLHRHPSLFRLRYVWHGLQLIPYMFEWILFSFSLLVFVIPIFLYFSLKDHQFRQKKIRKLMSKARKGNVNL